MASTTRKRLPPAQEEVEAETEVGELSNGSTPSLLLQKSEDGEDDSVEECPTTGKCRSCEQESITSGWRFDTVNSYHLPAFLKENEFLLSGHRPQLESVKDCIKSVFRIHSETGNIWTHLAGSLLFFILMMFVLFQSSSLVDWHLIELKIVFCGFFAGALICMSCSAIYHMVLCHSHDTYRMCAKVDYCGVVALIVLSFPPWVYFGFYCQTSTRIIYITMVLILGAITLFVVSTDGFGKPHLRPVRAGVFLMLGLTGLLPGLHYILKPDGGLEFGSWLLVMAAFYVVGAGIYAMRIPERFWPGKFDIWLQSHQIMHMCVIAGAFSCYHGSYGMAYHTLGNFDSCDI